MKKRSPHLVAFFLALGATSACASSKNELRTSSPGQTEVSVEAPSDRPLPANTSPTAEPKEIIAGTLTGPMTEDDALNYLRTHQEKFDACYETEAIAETMNSASYVFELGIPANGIEQPPLLRHRSDPTKFALEHCVTEAMEHVDFPAHRGEPLRFQVRIRGTMPAVAGAPVALIEAEPKGSARAAETPAN